MTFATKVELLKHLSDVLPEDGVFDVSYEVSRPEQVDMNGILFGSAEYMIRRDACTGETGAVSITYASR